MDEAGGDDECSNFKESVPGSTDKQTYTIRVFGTGIENERESEMEMEVLDR